jgi:hypothetical protein
MVPCSQRETDLSAFQTVQANSEPTQTPVELITRVLSRTVKLIIIIIIIIIIYCN